MVNLTIVCLWQVWHRENEFFLMPMGGNREGGIYRNANNLADLSSFLILKKVLKLFFSSLKSSAVIQG